MPSEPASSPAHRQYLRKSLSVPAVWVLHLLASRRQSRLLLTLMVPQREWGQAWGCPLACALWGALGRRGSCVLLGWC